MRHPGVAIAAIVVSAAASASAQQPPLNDTQKLGQSAVRAILRRLSPQAADSPPPQFGPVLSREFGERQRGRHARGHRQRHAAHARLQVPVQAGPRSPRSRPISRPSAAAAAAPPARQARRPRRRLTRSSHHPILTTETCHDTRRCEARRPAGRARFDAMLVPAYAADAILSGAIASAVGREDGRRHRLGQGRRRDHHHHRVHRRRAAATSSRRCRPGKYRVWAQALTFETAKGEVDLAANKAQNFTLKPMTDYLPPAARRRVLAALPEETDHDKKMKRIVRNKCTGCHTPSYTCSTVRRGRLERDHRADEARQRLRHLSGREAQGERHARLQSEGARRLSRQGARPGREHA